LLRNTSVQTELDDAHFNAMNIDEHVLALNGYCLDALDQIPAGSCGGHWMGGTYFYRGMTEEEVKEAWAEVEECLKGTK
jgi:hypothetical protein